jgi:hypothetical protein
MSTHFSRPINEYASVSSPPVRGMVRFGIRAMVGTVRAGINWMHISHLTLISSLSAGGGLRMTMSSGGEYLDSMMKKRMKMRVARRRRKKKKRLTLTMILPPMQTTMNNLAASLGLANLFVWELLASYLVLIYWLSGW